MEVGTGWNGNTNMHEDAALKNNVEAEKIPSIISDQEDSDKNGEKKTNTVSFLKLFSFADSTDVLLMIIGTIGAIGNGLGMPIMTILFGEMINVLGSNQNNKDVVREVSKVCVKFLYMAAGIGFAGFLQVACWMVTGERQAARIRGLYLKTILRQDVAFFDLETNTGEVVGRMSASGGLMSIISKTASRGQSAYANASNVVEQTIGSIRTVASFTGEKQAINNYKNYLITAYKSGVHEGLASGLGLATFMLVMFSSYGLAIWYESKLILNKGCNGGDVLNVIAAIIIGSMD